MMVRSVKKSGSAVYLCELCMFTYKGRGTAQECEKFCKAHKGCSMEITKHSVGYSIQGILSYSRGRNDAGSEPASRSAG
jgi:hypothetical protein